MIDSIGIHDMFFSPQPKTINRKPYSSGQVLIEVLIATSVLTVGFLGIITLLNRSLSLNRIVSDNFTANYLAAEGIEVVKNLVDTNIFSGQAWNNGVIDGCYEVTYESTALPTPLGSGSDCEQSTDFRLFQTARPLVNDDATKLFVYKGIAGNEAGSFRRIIRIETKPGNNEIQVNSIVRWYTRGSGVYTINVEDHFYNWRT